MFGRKREGSVKHTRSIRRRIMNLVVMALIPMTIVAVIAIWSMHSFYQEYDQSVVNITRINAFNVSFEEQMNRSMYYLITESYDWSALKGTDAPSNPYTQIALFRATLDEVEKEAATQAIQSDIQAIRKMLDSLSKRVDIIMANVEEGGHYDENMEMLTGNVYVLTSLIQDDIVDYISMEVQRMDEVHSQLSGRVHLYVTVLGVLVAVLLTISLLLSTRISRKITEPVRDMCRMTERFAGGDFTVRVEGRSGDEMDTLADSFNSMVSEIHKLVEDIRIEQRSARKLEFKLLQAQINPHFLYNTLDAIMWLVESGQNDKAVRMVSSLSSFFRTTLSKGRDWITTQEEERHIRSYLEIQQFRYADILDYEIEIDPQIHGFYLTKLMLQPIVENALYHGIKNKRGMGLIRVRGFQQDGCLIFTVEDNGIGMTRESLAHMRKLISGEEADTSQNGFGIANVQQRIELVYGSDYGITVESEYEVGTKVTVKIPELDKPRE